MMRRLHDPTVVALIGVVVLLVAVVAVERQGRAGTTALSRRSCNASAPVLASGARGQADYLAKVIEAVSVKSDVKDAARTAWASWNAMAVTFERRAHGGCDRLFPKRSFFDLTP